MVLATSINSVVYFGNSASINFPIPFKFLDNDHIIVTIENVSTGVKTVVNPNLYTLSGVGKDDGRNLNITSLGIPFSAQTKITIKREVPYTQELNIYNQGGFFPKVLEQSLDLQEMQIQQIVEKQTETQTALLEAKESTENTKAKITDLVSAFKSAQTGSWDARGTLAERTAYDNAAFGFTFLDTTARPPAAYVREGAVGNWAGPYTIGLIAANKTEAEAGTDVTKYITPLGANQLFGASFARRAPRITDFGAKAAGEFGASSIDNVTAIRNAFAAVVAKGGGDLVIPSGNFELASAALTISITQNKPVRLIGEGQDTSRLKVTGNTSTRAIFLLNQSGSSFSGFGFEGNNTPVIGGESQFAYINPKASTLVPTENLVFSDLKIENLASLWWIAGWNESNYPLQGIFFERMRFVSKPGNNTSPTNLGGAADLLMFTGMVNNYTGVVRDVNFRDLWVDGSSIKKILSMYGGCKNFDVNNVYGFNIGADSANESGVYAFMAYNNAQGLGWPVGDPTLTPTDLTIRNCRIEGSKTCHVYLASAGNIRVESNEFIGQTDTLDGSQSVGGICGAAKNLWATDNYIEDCYRGINLLLGGPNLSGRTILSGNTIKSNQSSAIGIKALGSTDSNCDLVLLNNSVDLPGVSSRGAYIESGLNYGPKSVIERGNVWKATSYDCQYAGGGNNPQKLRYVTCQNNEYKGSGDGLVIPAPIGDIEISNNSFQMFDRSAGSGLVSTNFRGYIGPNFFKNKVGGTSGRCLILTGGQGGLSEQIFINVTDTERILASGSGTDLGLNVPTLTWGTEGQYVAKINRQVIANEMIKGWHFVSNQWRTEKLINL